MATIKKAGEIRKYLDAEKENMRWFLKQLVMAESPSTDKESQEHIMKLLKKEFEQLGFYTFRFPGKETGGYLYARPLGRKKNASLQLLVGHCDTVWKLNTLSKMPVVERDGKMTGPGVYDMKAGLTQLLFALKAINKLSLPIGVTPVVLINSDEEIGSKESTRIISRLAKIADRAFVLEPPLGPEGKLKTARKGIGRFTITVKGKAAHAGLNPEKGINAIVELSHQVQQLYAMNDSKKGITVNVGMISGGVSANVVAPESSAVIDVRVYNKEDGAYITEKIHRLKPKLPNVKLIVEGGIGRQPMEKNQRNEKLWKLAKAKSKLLGLSLEEATAGGGSDGNTTSLYTSTLDGLGTPGGGAHATHEFILEDKLIERTALIVLLLMSNPINNH